MASETVLPLRFPPRAAEAPVWGRIRLLDAEPGLAVGLATAKHEALSRLVVPALRLPAGDWTPPERLDARIGAVVVGGMLLRAGDSFGRADLQLFGPGDILDGEAFAEPGTTWRVLEPAHLAVLGDRFIVAARRWPELISGFARMLFDAQREQHMRAAICTMPRVEERILALFGHLACRWGRVTPHGITLSLPITHEILGALIGARRPTVSLALATLREQQLVTRSSQGLWLLPQDCVEWLAHGIPGARRAFVA
jgi:CRP/FNR family transcriptional regulator, cyclic AMP receptor protein